MTFTMGSKSGGMNLRITFADTHDFLLSAHICGLALEAGADAALWWASSSHAGSIAGRGKISSGRTEMYAEFELLVRTSISAK